VDAIEFVFGTEEGVFGEADVDESGLHTGEDVDDAGFVDIADDAGFAFEVEFGEATFFEDGDA